MGALRPTQLLVLLLIILLLFGARRLPDLAKSVGQSLKIFRSEVKDLQDDGAPAPSPQARLEGGVQAHDGLDGGVRAHDGSPRAGVARPDAPAA